MLSCLFKTDQIEFQLDINILEQQGKFFIQACGTLNQDSKEGLKWNQLS